MSPDVTCPRNSRPGSALLIALALLALSAALLVGSSAAGRWASRSVLSHGAVAVADAQSHAALAEFMAGWGGAQESLGIGQDTIIVMGPSAGSVGTLSVATRVRLKRLTSSRFILAIDCQVGAPGAMIASRRLHLILDRPIPADTTAPPIPPVPISQWSLADLY